MRYQKAEKVMIFATAIRQFTKLEVHRDKLLKYLDFIDIYSNLSDNEIQQYQQRYKEEDIKMSAFADRFIEQGVEQGIEQGIEIVAKNMQKAGMSIEEVVKLTGLTREQITQFFYQLRPIIRIEQRL